MSDDYVLTTGETDVVHRLMDTLAYYHCRSVNPKADDRVQGYHTFSADQRLYLQEMEREAAEEVARMWAAHDQALRDQIAQAIEVEMRRHDHAQIGFSAVGDAYAHAARIARGEQA